MSEENAARIFAGNIASLRKQHGLSQYDLADKTGISRRMICHYENEGIIPPVDRLQALAGALEVLFPGLFEFKKEKPSPVDLTGIDPRSVKKLKDILSLPAEDRNDLYRILNKMVRKNQLENQK